MEKASGNVERRKSATKKQSNGMPATEWKLTEKTFGESACVQKSVKSETQAGLTVANETQKGVVRKNRTTEPTIEQRAVEIAVDRHNEAADLRAMLALAEKQRDAHFAEAELAQKKISDLEDDVRRQSGRAEDGERANAAWLSLAAEYECKSIPDFRVFIESLERRVDVLKMAVESMHEQLDAKQRNTSFDVSSAAQYIVKTPSRPPRFTKLHKNAHAVAMSSARQHGFAEVFALIPVGKAIRGAEWRPK